jgi:thiamine pyrophosphate-dependent acetolactate synthase large subunit-like protein
MTVGAGLALKGSGRIPIALMGDGDFLMGNTAVWTAAHYQIPCLMIVCNNRSFYNDELHQGRMAAHRGRPEENRWIGQHIAEPDIDIAAMARAQGALGIGPVTKIADVQPAIEQGIAAVRGGQVCIIDARVLPGRSRLSRASAAERLRTRGIASSGCALALQRCAGGAACVIITIYAVLDTPAASQD